MSLVSAQSETKDSHQRDDRLDIEPGLDYLDWYCSGLYQVVRQCENEERVKGKQDELGEQYHWG